VAAGGGDGDGGELFVSGGDGGADGGALGADGKAVRGVFDVRAGEYIAGGGEDGGADVEF
jgi:hypothetical protein